MKIIDFIKSNNKYFEDYITRSTYHSNAIEGSTLSYAETYAIIFNDNSFKVNAAPREIYEAINHKYALDYVLKHIDEPLNERFIKDIATFINKNVTDFSDYRTVSVFISGAEHVPPPAEKVRNSMMYLVHNYNNTEFAGTFEKVAQFHIDFEKIHPFQDGNGRTGRLLINYELLRNDIAPAVIEKDDRIKYFNFLSNSDVKGLAAFIEELSCKEYERVQQFASSKPKLESVEKPSTIAALKAAKAKSNEIYGDGRGDKSKSPARDGR
jgi:Fic family protein